MATARAWFATAAAIAADHHFRGALWLASAGLALAAAALADVEGARAACRRVSELSPMDHQRADVAAVACWVAAAVGDISAARDMMTDAAEMARLNGAHTTEALLLCDIARLGDPGSVRERLDQLVVRTESALIQARAAYAGALADRDPQALERAARRFEDFGVLLLAAEAWASAAEYHRRAGDGHPARSAAARAARLAARCEGARNPFLSLPTATHTLTPREREVAQHALQGRSSKEIADQLVVSVRTVETHLQHVYQKMGINRREDLHEALMLPGASGTVQLRLAGEGLAAAEVLAGAGDPGLVLTTGDGRTGPPGPGYRW
jgi:DNA-binding CsgD family transcriptional regulator